MALDGGDMHGDGIPDLEIGQVVLLGVGDGTFTVGRVFADGQAAVGDFNADGKPDLAVANEGSDNVRVLTDTP